MPSLAPSDMAPSLERASGLVPCPLEWLWPGRLAVGKLAILDGDPGLGKSLIALDLCARLTTGRPFPDAGAAHPAVAPAAVVILNGEDGSADTLCPRLRTLGADLDRVFLQSPAGVVGREPFRFPGHAPSLADAVARTGARLVVIDPIMAFLDRAVVTASDQSVRRALWPLAELAEVHRCTVLLVRHLTKSGKARSLYRGGGSIGIVGACRSALLAARDPLNPARCVLGHVKSNLAALAPSLAYELRPGNDAAPPALA